MPPPVQSAEALAKSISKECKHGFSSAYLLILPAILYGKYRVNDLDY